MGVYINSKPVYRDRRFDESLDPPEGKDDGRTCDTCYRWDRCPCGCAWGACEVDNELRRDDFSCKDWEEA